jgi:acyl carrier protein
VSLEMSVDLTDEYSVTVNSEELFGTMEYVTIDEL